VLFREALITDIPQIQVVRHLVKENTLSDPSLVTGDDCAEFITRRGKGWVCMAAEQLTGFAIADLKENNIWALFVHPDFEGRGIGKHLHYLMLNWYFEQGKQEVWLGTSPNTRAEKFYTCQGWTHKGVLNKNEVKFEMTKQEWKSFNK
jgi:GNAT superfamily N-acetyltransferase